MPHKENDNDLAFLLGAGVSKEAGVDLGSAWQQALEPLVKSSIWSSGLKERLRRLSGDPFDTGDLDDGEKFVKKLAFLAADDVSYNLHAIKKKFDNQFDPEAATAFEKVAMRLKDLTTVNNSNNLEYLTDLVHFADWRAIPSRDGFAHIFTLNYDNTIEEVARHLGYICLSMPRVAAKQEWFERNLEIRGVNLLKINGSSDWSFQKGDTGFGIANTLLHGHSLWSPSVENVCFLDLVDTHWATDLARVQKEELVERLKETSYLVVIGYSFRRTDIISTWCRSGRALQVTIFDPAPSRFHLEFQKRCREFARCKIVEKTASEAIRSL